MPTITLRLQTRIWRFYFDRATPRQQRVIRTVMGCNGQSLFVPAVISLSLFTAWHMAIIMVATGLIG